MRFYLSVLKVLHDLRVNNLPAGHNTGGKLDRVVVDPSGLPNERQVSGNVVLVESFLPGIHRIAYRFQLFLASFVSEKTNISIGLERYTTTSGLL